MGFEVDIKKKMGDFQLDVSFAGDDLIIAVLGASGCGKSMTLKCIAGIETPDEGRIVLNGRVLYDSEEKINLPPQKRKVGYMFQDYALFPNMTVRQNIEIAINSQKEKNSGNTEAIDKSVHSADEIYERFRLTDIVDLYPAQLSGGQKQRVAMARMIAAGPEMILLDEPFAALDTYLKWQMENEVKQVLKSENKPTVFVSHDRDEVYRLCDYAGIMSEGMMHGIHNTKELFKNPKTKMAAMVSGCKNITEAERIDTYRVYVPSWDAEFTTSTPVTFEKGYIGIRAHSFEMADNGYGDKNCVCIDTSEVNEEPFEWTVSFKTAKSSEWIQWKVSKELWQYSQDSIPKRLWVKPENIMLLDE